MSRAQAPTSPRLSHAAETLLTYIRQHDYVSFVEAERILTPYMPTQGGWALESNACRNLTLWCGMSREVLNVLHELLDHHHVYAELCSPLPYLVDGATLRLPQARRPTTQGYASPHWRPVVLRPTTTTSGTAAHL